MVAVLFNAGDHVPVIPLREVVGKTESVAPEQIGPTGLKVGATLALTVIDIDVEIAHEPVEGVKSWTIVPSADVLIDAGFQVPVIELDDVVGKIGNVIIAFWQ